MNRFIFAIEVASAVVIGFSALIAVGYVLLMWAADIMEKRIARHNVRLGLNPLFERDYSVGKDVK